MDYRSTWLHQAGGEHAANLSHLRANRDHWRHQLQASPLGDAEDLMHHLEAAFSQMHSEVLRKANSSTQSSSEFLACESHFLVLSFARLVEVFVA